MLRGSVQIKEIDLPTNGLPSLLFLPKCSRTSVRLAFGSHPGAPRFWDLSLRLLRQSLQALSSVEMLPSARGLRCTGCA